jgi:hypothetical protein
MGRGKRHQGCESAASHCVCIQRTGCGHAERLDCTSRESSCSRPVAGSGWAAGMKSIVQDHRSSPSAQAPRLGREKTWPIFRRRGRQDRAISLIPRENRGVQRWIAWLRWRPSSAWSRREILLGRSAAASSRSTSGFEDGCPAGKLSRGQAAHALHARADAHRSRARLFRTRQARDRGGR